MLVIDKMCLLWVRYACCSKRSLALKGVWRLRTEHQCSQAESYLARYLALAAPLHG